MPRLSPYAKPEAKPQQVAGPCAKPGCDEHAGHGPGNALCERHASAAAATAARIIRTAKPARMTMHQGPAMTLKCGHKVSAGDHAVSVGGQWICETCALRP